MSTVAPVKDNVWAARTQLTQTAKRKEYKAQKAAEIEKVQQSAQPAIDAARSNNRTPSPGGGFSPRRREIDDGDRLMQEALEESKADALEREVSYLQKDKQELISTNAALAERVDNLVQDLNRENDRATRAEQDAAQAAQEKEAAEAQLNSALRQLAAAKQELDATKTRQAVADLKGRLEDVTQKLNAHKDDALKVLTKGELPDSYKDKFNQGENSFFNNLRMELTALNQSVSQCGEDYRNEASEMKQVVERGHVTADHWNADNVMLAKARSIAAWLNEAIQTPHDVKVLSQKIDSLRTRLDAFVSRDLMDNMTFTRMLEKATQSLNEDEKSKLTDDDKLTRAKAEFQKCGEGEKKQLIAKEYTAMMEDLKAIQAMKARIEEKTVSQPNQSKINAFLQKVNEQAVQTTPKESSDTENCELYRETVRASLTTEFSSIQSTQKELYTQLRNFTSATWNKACNREKVLEQDLEMLNDRLRLIRSLNDMFEDINAIKGGAVKGYTVSTVDQLKKDLGDLEPQFLGNKDALTALRDKFYLLDGKYASKLSELDAKLKDRKAVALNAELEAYGVNEHTPKEKVLEELTKTTQALRQSIFDQRALLTRTWDALKQRVWDTGKDLNYIDSKVKAERNIMGGGRFHDVYYAINTPPAPPKAEVKPVAKAEVAQPSSPKADAVKADAAQPASSKTEVTPPASPKANAAQPAEVKVDAVQPAAATETAAVSEPVKDKKE